MVSRSLGLVDSRSELMVLVTNRTGNESAAVRGYDFLSISFRQASCRG